MQYGPSPTVCYPCSWSCAHTPYRLSALAARPSSESPTLANKAITLLIAHPDDEAMFFAPTLLALAPYNTVRVLCLSSGDADGLGAIRKRELQASCHALGVSGGATVVEDAALPDSMTSAWPADAIAGYLRQHADEADVLVTFDEHGVSAHPNHISLLHGARAFVRESSAGGRRRRLFTLTTVGLARKYLSVLDAPMTLSARKGLVFVSTAAQVGVAQRAMTQAHKSQMRWFRWGWIGLSRYMVINDLTEETIL